MIDIYRSDKEYILDDNYEVISGISRSAHGELYRVTDLAEDTEHLAKQTIVHKNQLSVSVDDISNKLTNLKKNGYPAIVPIIDFEVKEEEDDIVVWVVMDESPSASLAQIIQFHIDETDQILNERQKGQDVQQISIALCEAIEHFHKIDIVHGNIKPQNIFEV